METAHSSSNVSALDTNEGWLLPAIIGATVGIAIGAALFVKAPALALALPLLCAAAAIDAVTMRLPDRLILPAMAVACFGASLWGNPTDALFGLAFAILVGMATHLARPNGMGLGDVKLLAVIGGALGFHGAITTVIVGCFFAITAIVISRCRKQAMYEIPAGPYFVAGSIIAAISANCFPHSS